MKSGMHFLLRKLRRDEGGQSLVLMALAMFVMIGLVGITVDFGRVYVLQQKLRASTNSAALAAAQALPDSTQALKNVDKYSSKSGGLNAHPLLLSDSTSTTFKCLNTLEDKFGLPCVTLTTSAGGASTANAVQVSQAASVPAIFGSLFGVAHYNLAATASASMAGASNTPWNIAIVLDTSGSMDSWDSQCDGGTRIACALNGVQTLLGLMYPTADKISLYVFPAVLGSTAKYEYATSNCSAINYDPSNYITVEPYTFTLPATTLPSTYAYQIIGFSNDYKASNSSSSLQTSSKLVIAAGGSGSNCSGIQAIGGLGTYYPQVIYQAQADLVAQQAANPNSRNAMIILGDGDQYSSNFVNKGSGMLNGTGTRRTNPSGYNSVAYPSAKGQCGQSVLAAQAAAAAGTRVYTVGYGASPYSGCDTDATYSATAQRNGTTVWARGYSPCDAMNGMASDAAYFYSDDAEGCSSVNGTNFTKLTQIFQAIAGTLTNPRLIPNGTT